MSSGEVKGVGDEADRGSILDFRFWILDLCPKALRPLRGRARRNLESGGALRATG